MVIGIIKLGFSLLIAGSFSYWRRPMARFEWGIAGVVGDCSSEKGAMYSTCIAENTSRKT